MKAIPLWLAGLLLVPMTAPAAAGEREAELALARASTAIAAAQRIDADAYASDPLAIGRAALSQAQRACAVGAWLDCERAAERAHADARLAEARTRQSRAEADTERLAAAVQSLRDELDLRGG